MHILVAPDKFKGSLGAAEVAEQIAAGLRDVLPEAEIALQPMADGGEGTAAVICAAAGGAWHECETHDPRGRKVRAQYGMIEEGTVAVMEMSQASGLWRLSPNEYNPGLASSFGTGGMLLEAARGGASKIILGLGGSATNDGGFGMARALGFRFFDERGNALAGPVSDLLALARIEFPTSWPWPALTGAVDVRNPLLGENGATRVFGAQKGATPEQMEMLEAALIRLAEVCAAEFGLDFRDSAGAGAAGGLGFGLMTFAKAELRSGFELVAEHVGLEEAMRRADVVITGEGRLDAQSLGGKTPVEVVRMARRLGKRCYAIVGGMEDAAEVGRLFYSCLVLRGDGVETAEAISNAGPLLRARAREIGAQIRSGPPA